jgi:tetratricopeptide (TPR) repeat protein
MSEEEKAQSENSDDDDNIPDEQGETLAEGETDLQGEEAPLEPWDEVEEEEFDLESQIEVFRQLIEEEPDNCLHHYNLGEALEELGNSEEAKLEYEKALVCDTEGEFSAIIHYGLGNLYYEQLLSGIQSVVVHSSVGLHSAHKPGDAIVEVHTTDYQPLIDQFEMAIKDLPKLKADDEIVDFVAENAPLQLANVYYKWSSDLIDKSRQILKYGEEVKDVKQALKYLKKTLEIEPNHSQASLMVKYAKKMLAEGWQSYDEYGFLAKQIDGSG